MEWGEPASRTADHRTCTPVSTVENGFDLLIQSHLRCLMTFSADCHARRLGKGITCRQRWLQALAPSVVKSLSVGQAFCGRPRRLLRVKPTSVPARRSPEQTRGPVLGAMSTSADHHSPPQHVDGLLLLPRTISIHESLNHNPGL